MISRTAEVATPTESWCGIISYLCRLWGQKRKFRHFLDKSA
jgi:hypothetical protein